MTAETKTSLARVCAVMVPKEASDIKWHHKPMFITYSKGCEIELPRGNWQILGELGQITEEQAALVMPSRMIKKSWDDHLSLAYENPSRQKGTTVEAQLSSYVDTALEALSILADSMEVYAVNPYGEEPDPADYFNTKTPIDQFTEKDKQGLTEYGSKDMDWEYAQSRTGRYIILYQPIKNK